MKIIYDLRSNEHYISGSENKAWKKSRPVRVLNPTIYAVPVQCSIN